MKKITLLLTCALTAFSGICFAQSSKPVRGMANYYLADPERYLDKSVTLYVTSVREGSTRPEYADPSRRAATRGSAQEPSTPSAAQSIFDQKGASADGKRDETSEIRPIPDGYVMFSATTVSQQNRIHGGSITVLVRKSKAKSFMKKHNQVLVGVTRSGQEVSEPKITSLPGTFIKIGNGQYAILTN